MSAEESSRGTSSKGRAEVMTEAFAKQFPATIVAELTSLNDADLELVFRAANVATFYTQSDEHLGVMRTAFDELGNRGLVVRRTFADMHGATMAARQFDNARGLARAYGQWVVEPSPQLEDSPDGAVTALEIKEAGLLNPVSVGVQSGAHIVVISHPLCHFSRRAVAAIESDIELSKALEGAVWMTPVDRSLHLDVLNDWNKNHPERQMVIAYSRKAWPQFESWSTPTFYFLMDNKVVDVVEGWPEEGRKPEIMRAAKTIGR
ncbi:MULTISPECIES: hypothetical protein [unclassified Pseudoxanthomonas]|uniref:hypothetical protein n=1 Tax=unclassified Pseudoxanthomonas TaxID=2645906 RepID=UPI0030769744